MLKNILKLDGVKELSKNEQGQVRGGGCNGQPIPECDCPGYASNGGQYAVGSTVYNNRLDYCYYYQNYQCVCL